MSQPRVIVFSSSDVSKVVMTDENNTFTGTNEFDGANTLDGATTINGALSGTSVKDEDNMASNSNTAVATQQSTKAYIDALGTTYIKVAGGNSASNIIIENDTSDGDITFKVNDGGVDTTVITIDGGTGNVGIGTTSPDFKLQISGSVAPEVDSTSNLGDSTLYWSNNYTDKIYLNGTATLDGSVAGQVSIVGAIRANGGFDENTSTAGFYAGGPDVLGTPRFMLCDGNASRSWQIDNNGGTMRFFTPAETHLSLPRNSQGFFRSGMVLNEDGADIDSRIEGDNDANLIYVDAGNDRIGVGKSNPASKLDVSGSLSLPYVAKSADYTATISDYTIAVTASTVNITITLPTASGITGRIYNIKKMDATEYTVIVDGNSSETIDGETTHTLSTQYESIQIQSDGTNWIII